jgi:hypothetical protein
MRHFLRTNVASGNRTVMIRADLQSLIPTHNQSRLVILLVLQQPHIPSATLLPLPGVPVELEQLSPHLERLLLSLLMRLGLDLLRQADDGFEVDVFALLDFFLQLPYKSA